MKNNKNYSKSK